MGPLRQGERQGRSMAKKDVVSQQENDLEAAFTYDAWVQRVDAIAWVMCGFGVRDLADCPYRAWYDDGVEPLEAAKRAIRREGGATLLAMESE
jgi:hypothetical protein